MTATDFADHLTRKGVYSFNIHDIRKYAAEYDRDRRERKIVVTLNAN